MSLLLLITISEINSMYFFVYLMVSGTYYWVMCKNEKNLWVYFMCFVKHYVQQCWHCVIHFGCLSSLGIYNCLELIIFFLLRFFAATSTYGGLLIFISNDPNRRVNNIISDIFNVINIRRSWIFAKDCAQLKNNHFKKKPFKIR